MRRFIALLCLLSFTAEAQLREWSDYRTILWMSGNVEKHKDQWPLIAQRMKELGINTGMGGRDAAPQRVVDSGFGYYVENVINKGLCLKFSSKVTNWSKFIDDWSTTRSSEAFVRDYCFDDPQWLGSVTDLMSKTAATHAPTKPLMYDLRDELSITISANPFDYDFSPLALEGFRTWLTTQYTDLAALNQQWDTEFKSWEAVMPFSTDQIKARMVTGEKHPTRAPDWSALKHITFDPAEAAKHPVRWNFSPWCDHRTYMDISLARTLGKLRDAAHAKDPSTPVGIEGLQMPSAFGGYDLWRLSQVLDWCEPYDVGNSREILGSFMPDKPMVCTVFEKDTDHARRRLWHLLLLGDRGCVVWWSDDIIDWSKPDLPLSEKGKALAPVLKEMQTPLAKLFIKAKREYDRIAIHYSQPSIQVAWLLESVADGKTWPRRFSSYEATHNKHAQVRNSWLKLLQDLGYSPRFLSDDQSKRALTSNGPSPHLTTPSMLMPPTVPSVLVVPESLAGDATLESTCMPSGTWTGHLYDGLFAEFDPHGLFRSSTRSATHRVSDVNKLHLTFSGSDGDQATSAIKGGSWQDYSKDRLQRRGEGLWPSEVGRWIQAKIGPPAIKTPLKARVRTHRFTLGQARLLAFERNIDYKMSEDLAQASGNEALEKPVTFTASWNGDSEVYDLRTGKHLGRKHEIEVNLDPWQPSLYALLPAVVEGDVVEHLSR